MSDTWPLIISPVFPHVCRQWSTTRNTATPSRNGVSIRTGRWLFLPLGNSHSGEAWLFLSNKINTGACGMWESPTWHGCNSTYRPLADRSIVDPGGEWQHRRAGYAPLGDAVYNQHVFIVGTSRYININPLYYMVILPDLWELRWLKPVSNWFKPRRVHIGP